jgi:hypothetical protein
MDYVNNLWIVAIVVVTVLICLIAFLVDRAAQPPEPDFTQFPAFLLNNASDEELTEEVISRFHDEFTNSRGTYELMNRK